MVSECIGIDERRSKMPQGMDTIGAEHWQRKLATSGHHIGAKEAVDLFAWITLRDGPLILQGEPGCGKTSLIIKIAEVSGAKLYRVQCYAGIQAGALLYRWNEAAQQMGSRRARATGLEFNWWDRSYVVFGKLAQALLDPCGDVIVLLDEMDKVEEGGECETALLEFTGEHKITINETNETIKRPQGLPPLAVAITSNAGPTQSRESLSDPVLRRARLIEFEPLSRDQIREILCSAVAALPQSLIDEVSWFVAGLRRTCNWQKPVSLSETIMWARTLELHGVSHLTEDIVAWTASALAKGAQEREDLRQATPRLLRQASNRLSRTA
jgi:MoxR-like ATPase